MDKPLLNDPDVFPTAEVLAATLGKSYVVLNELITTISSDDCEVDVDSMREQIRQKG